MYMSYFFQKDLTSYILVINLVKSGYLTLFCTFFILWKNWLVFLIHTLWQVSKHWVVLRWVDKKMICTDEAVSHMCRLQLRKLQPLEWLRLVMFRKYLKRSLFVHIFFLILAVLFFLYEQLHSIASLCRFPLHLISCTIKWQRM